MTISPCTFLRYAKDSAPQLFTFHSAAICQDWICLERCFGTRTDKSHKMNLTRSCSIEVWHWPRSLKPHSQAGVAINHQSCGGLFPSLLLYLDHGRGGLDAAAKQEEGVTLHQSATSAKRWVPKEGHRDGGGTVITQAGGQVMQLGWKPGTDHGRSSGRATEDSLL